MFKIFYKKFFGYIKGFVFWYYEINIVGDDNFKRWDYFIVVWGYDFFVVGFDIDIYFEEFVKGIILGEEFSYEIEVKEGIMYLKFISLGYEIKIFIKNLVELEYMMIVDIFE